MKILIVTDAWDPQVNGVVRTLKSTQRELEKMGHVVDLLTPLEFRTIPCPTYPEIRLSILPRRHVARRIAAANADAIHIAREGIATALVSVPNRYMHSPNEMVSLADLDRTATLLVEVCRAVTDETDFTAR